MVAGQTLPQAVRKSVLVVDDSAVIRRVMRVILEAEGYEVLTAESGLAALRTARQYRPHAVTLDLSLPDVDGREVLRSLKGDGLTSQIPVIVISTLSDVLLASDRRLAARVLTKPFDVDELLGWVARLTSPESS